MITILTKHDLVSKDKKKNIKDIDLSDFIGNLFNSIILSDVVAFVKVKEFKSLKG